MPQREPFARRALRHQIAKENRPPTVLEVAVIAVGLLRGSEALWGLLMWTVARRKNGGERPTYHDLMATSLVSRVAAFRQQALLREVWGGDEGLEAMADVIEAARGEAIAELAALSDGTADRATAMVLVASLPALGFSLPAHGSTVPAHGPTS
jgi:hypothetical protein